MGDPKKTRKKYDTPMHPWERSRIEEEAVLKKEYGFKNKREIWRVKSFLRRILHQAKKSIAAKSAQAQKEKEDMINRLVRIGLIKKGESIDSILNLKPKDIMERRLQTLVLRKGLAHTIKQSRQFIAHEHIYVNGKKITSPNYIVSVVEENAITFAPKSKFNNPEHTQRVVGVKK